MQRYAAMCLLAGLAAATPAWAQECDLGIVLSGGGARGAAHLGVLQVLEENGIRPDCITGASMGAIVGGLYAAGFELREIQALMAGLTWRNVYSEPMNRASMPIMHRLEQQRTALRIGFDGDGIHLPRGILYDGRLNRQLIQRLAPAGFAAGRDFDNLPIPFRAVATDLRTGDRVVLDHGDLALAVRASMSVPLAYPPVEREGALLVDGGLVDNLPVGLARDMGARFVVAVDVQTPIEPEIDADVVGVTRRIIDLLYDSKNRQYAEAADLTVVPDLDEHSFSDYSNLDGLVQQGRTAALAVLSQIPDRYRTGTVNRASAQGADAFEGRTIQRIDVLGNEYLSDDFVLRESELEVGKPFHFQELLTAVDHLYSTTLLQGSWVDVLALGSDGVAIEIRVAEQSRQTLDVGLAYQSDDQAQAFVRVETRDPFGGGERVSLNAFASARDLVIGATLRGEQLFRAHFGYQIDVEHHEEKPRLYVDTSFVNRAEFDRTHIRIGTDWQLSRRQLTQVGFLLGTVRTREQLGVPFPRASEAKRTIFGRYLWDELESLTHPRRGQRLNASLERNEEGLGATNSYWRLNSDLRLARSLGAAVVELRAQYGFSSGDLPVSEYFRIGGPELIPGVARDEFWGKQSVALSASLGYDPFSIVRVYARAGGGGVWDKPEHIGWAEVVTGVGFGTTIATPIGPIQLDYGWAEDGRNRVYVSLGWQ